LPWVGVPVAEREVGLMTLEISLPDEWPPGLALAVAQMMRESFKEGFPIIIPVRKDATPEQISAAFERARDAIQNLGLAA
jgi:hypothetical protein